MTAPDNIEPYDFPIIVSDGAYIHLIEGIATLQFFRDKYFPTHDRTTGILNHAKKTREILHEIRLPIPSTRRLVSDLKDALNEYETFGLLPLDRESWFAPEFHTGEKYEKIEDSSRFTTDGVLLTTFLDIAKNLDEEGSKKVMELYLQWLHNNIDAIREIARKHSKKKEEAKKDATKQ